MNEDIAQKLVVVDDDSSMARFIADVANMSGYAVSHYCDAREFVAQYNNDLDVIVLDLIMPNMSGFEVIDFLAERKSGSQLILMTGFNDDVLQNARLIALNKGLNFVSGFKKPFRFNDLHSLLIKLRAVRSGI